MKYKDLYKALEDPEAAILVYGKISLDGNGNSRARQSVYDRQGTPLYVDGRIRSYWSEDQTFTGSQALRSVRQSFRANGGLILSA